MEPWLSTPCSSSVSINNLFDSKPSYYISDHDLIKSEVKQSFFYLCPTAHWDEKFHEKMVDDRVFLVTRSFTVGVPMMHRTGEFFHHCWFLMSDSTRVWTKYLICLTALHTGLYDFYEDTVNSIFVLNMPLGQKQASMILIMTYHLEPLVRLEKLLTRNQVDTWLSKMENRAVSISLPKISMEVSHNLQVNGGQVVIWWFSQA